MNTTEGRRFGAELAAGFGLLASVAWWRSHETAAAWLAGVAAASALAALVVPARLAPVRTAWMAVGHLMGRVMSPLFFGVVYFAVLTPIGLLRRTFGRSPLQRGASAASYWIERESRPPDVERRSMERYF